jgi:kynurenine formamidase
MASLPKYADLPQLGSMDVRHSWDALASEIGTLSFIEPENIVAASRLVSGGITIPLNLPIDAFDPPLFDRSPVRHEVVETSRVDAEDVIDGFNPQASSQLDGLAHVRAREHGYFGGILELSEARERIGMHHVARKGIAARGVLLDLAERDRAEGVTPFEGRMYNVELLEQIAAEQGIELRRGDIILIRTAWAASYLDLPEAERVDCLAWNGLRADEAMAAWLWNHRIAAVGADNPAVECAPGSRDIGSLHRRLLPALGMPLLELLDLERLAAQCRRTGRWEFLFLSVPLHLRRGVSSPANAMALL